MSHKRTSLFLMANLGAEVSRMFSYTQQGEYQEAEEALGRALGILEEVRHVKGMELRKEELDLLEQALIESIKKKSILSISPDHLKAYFLPFAIKQMQS